MTSSKHGQRGLAVLAYTTTEWPVSKRIRRRAAALRKLMKVDLTTAPNLEAHVVDRLLERGYKSVGSVLVAASTSRQRMFLACETDLSASELWRTVSVLDLSRVRSLRDYAIPALISLGITSVGRLARQTDVSLTMVFMNFERDDLDLLEIDPEDIATWIKEAATLPLILDC